MITSTKTQGTIWAAAAVAGASLVVGLVITTTMLITGSRSDQTQQLAATGQPPAAADASQPASQPEGVDSPSSASDQAAGLDPSSDPSDGAAPEGPTSDDPEVVEGTPGVVGTGGSTPPATPPGPSSPESPELEDVVFVPTPIPPTPTPPTVEPIDLLEVGSGGSNPSGGESGGFAPNVSGCALNCVTMAVLTPNVTTPNLGLEVESTVAARIDITMTNTETGKQSLFTSSGFKTQWSTTLSPLDPATEYDLVLEATDQEGQRQVHSTTLTTRPALENPGGLQTNQPGCAGGCIVEATVTTADRPSEVRFEVETDTPAQVRIWASTSEPQWVDGVPTLPADSIVEPTLGLKQEFAVEKSFDPGSRYHVVVRAEDEHGADYQVGHFTTAAAPASRFDVRVNFERIHVRSDGDPLPGDRGELRFAIGYGVEASPSAWYLTEAKIGDGTTIQLGDETEHWLTIGPNGFLPRPGVTAHERDSLFLEHVFYDLVAEPVDNIQDRANPAWGPDLTLNGLRGLQTCGEMGVESAAADAYCIAFESVEQDDKQFPHFQVVISYELHES
ncbi:MAG: hypothetical protein AAFO29_00090 [Actinomycetota bacterium]